MRPNLTCNEWLLAKVLSLSGLVVALAMVMQLPAVALAQSQNMMIMGQVQLQGRSDNSGVIVRSGNHQVETGPDGRFELALEAYEMYDFQIEAAGYLRMQAQGFVPAGVATVNMGSIMLLGGDINGDDQIDVFDLAYLGNHYQSDDPMADINADGRVEIFDIAVAAGNYGQQATVIAPDIDETLRQAMAQADISPLDPGPQPEPAKVKLGQNLFFDKELSGNRDIACSTCHHPFLHTSDGTVISIGTGSRGLGPERALASGRRLHPRNSPDLFNRGVPEWHRFFGDGRVNGSVATGVETPAGDQLPAELDSLVAALAMFPVTARDEMRGQPGDLDINGQPNELADIADEDFILMWDSLMARLLAIPEYERLFQEAYPGVPIEALGFQHAANANAAFIIDSFTLLNSPWDRYVAGDNAALSEQQKRGALLFYGRANCYQCHTGNLLTDQEFHNIAVPQVGPGQAALGEMPLDFGRFRESGVDEAERFAFRTPPLRNVALTGPWTHAGAFNSLSAVVRHHINPEHSLRNYDVSQLPLPFQLTVRDDEATIQWTLATLDPLIQQVPELTDEEVDQLVAFLEALTDPAAVDMRHLIPATVPSGLPVED